MGVAKLLIHDSISRLTKKHILSWLNHVQLAEKEQSLWVTTPTVFVLPSLTLQVTSENIPISSGLLLQMAHV